MRATEGRDIRSAIIHDGTLASVLFLGAGAHSPFCPDNKTMLETFKEDSPRRSVIMIEGAEKALRRLHCRVDLETIYTYLKIKSNPLSSITQVAPIIAALWRDKREISYLEMNNPNEKKTASDTLSRLQEYVVTQTFLPDQVEEITRFYDTLLRGDLLDGVGLNSLDIFTTNYDNILELYLVAQEVDYGFGYSYISNGSHYVYFDPRNDYTGSNHNVRLYYLHGSVTLYLLENKKIYRSQRPLKVGDRIDGYGVVENVMIFPVQDKYISKDPYNTLDHLFRERLNNIDNIFVIGHSFNDEGVLNLFIDSLQKRNSLKVFNIGRNPKQVYNMFPASLHSRIYHASVDIATEGFLPMEFRNKDNSRFL